MCRPCFNSLTCLDLSDPDMDHTVVEIKKCFRERFIPAHARSCIPHLAMTDCRSLFDYLDAQVLAKASDRRLGIELRAIHENIWVNGRRAWVVHPNGWRSSGLGSNPCHGCGLSDEVYETRPLLRVLPDCLQSVQKQKPK